ncbi:MAG: alpha/beta hydrolase [Phormidesmis sp.]
MQFFYGPFEPTIYIEDLEYFAETGESPQRLSILTRRLSEAQLDSLQSLLTARIGLSAVTISQFTYGPVGEPLLDRMGQVVQTDSFLSGARGIRAALILAADSENGLSLLNVMRYFPSRTIQLDWSLVRQILDENQRIFDQRDEVLADLRQVAATQTNNLSSFPDLQLDQLGQYSWRIETFSFQNPERLQASSADLYLPIEHSTEQVPVVIISHGTASNRQTLAYLAAYLSSHGYAVAIPEHAETSTAKFQRFLNGLEGAPDPAELLYRPRDITALLDTLEQRAQREPVLQSLKLDSVGILGQSFGGYTALAVAGAELNNRSQLEKACFETVEDRPTLNLSMLIQCRLLEIPIDASFAVQDERIKAVIALNPITSYLFGESGLSTLTVPSLIVASADDFFVPALPEQIVPFQWIQSDVKSLLIVEAGTHFSFLAGDEEGVFPVPQALVGPDPLLARVPMQTLSLAFFNRHLLKQAEAEAYLTQAYINTLELSPFRLTFVHTSGSGN